MPHDVATLQDFSEGELETTLILCD
jgi:hypothetical protein